MLAVENQDGGPLDGVLGYTPRDDVNDSDDAPANEETDMKNEQVGMKSISTLFLWDWSIVKRLK